MPDEHAALTAALWALFAHCHDAFWISPILVISSPEKRCGKTTLLRALSNLVPRSIPSSNISPAVLFRVIERDRPCLLIDEADTYLRHDNHELRGIINAGHTRDLAFVLRCDGDDNEPVKFSTWAPKVIALIKNLPETIEDRAIILRLRRKLPGETVNELRFKDCDHIFGDTVRRCIRWACHR